MKFNSMSEILNTPIEKCLEGFKELPKGELVNLVQLFKIQYEQTNHMKNALLVLVENHKKGINKMPKAQYKEHLKVIDELYLSLQLMEDRHNIAEELLTELNKKEKGRLVKVNKELN